jgi:glycosyltransferase involved in cell wall biosynthesis
MKIALVVPHIFMHPEILPRVIFSPGQLALQLAEGLQKAGDDLTLFTPGAVTTKVPTITADMSPFDRELAGRGDSYMDLLKKHPFTFVTLARQVQSELIADAFARANSGEFDLVHVYCNEEEMALPFARLCQKPVVFTHHDPFNFLVKYKSVFPKYAGLNWLSMSLAQRRGMPQNTNWVANIYHGLRADTFQPVSKPADNYVAYIGRIIQPKGVHLAIAAVQKYNVGHPRQPLTLKIAGKHYADASKDTYWQDVIAPCLTDPHIEYVGFIDDPSAKREFLANARALLVPSLFEEPFGMVMIEALACGTPLIGLESGAIPEVILSGKTGFVIPKIRDDKASTPAKAEYDETAMTTRLAQALEQIPQVDRRACRADFEARFTRERMVQDHQAAYHQLVSAPGTPPPSATK